MSDPYKSYDNNQNSYGGGNQGNQGGGNQKKQWGNNQGGGGGYQKKTWGPNQGGTNGYQKKTWDNKQGGGGGYQKGTFTPPDLAVQHVVAIALESKTPIDMCENQLLDALNYLTKNEFCPRVNGPDDLHKMAHSINPNTIGVGPWKKFNELVIKACPNDQVVNLAKLIFPHIENISEAAQKFTAANITTITGLPYGERAYALIIHTPNGTINPDELPESHKYLNPVMRIAQIYKVPIVNLGAQDFMERLERETITRYSQM